ncbi:MAG: hypothetical protein DMF81_17925, partial [Acidobacteria bacterium]
MNRSGGALVTLVRCRVSAGARLSLSFRGSEKVDLAEAVKRGREFPWRLAGPVIAGPAPAGKLAATRGWQAGPGVGALSVRDGRLVGRSTSDFPLLHLERSPAPADRDILHAVEVRCRVSAGARLSLSFRGSEKVDLAEAV